MAAVAKQKAAVSQEVRDIMHSGAKDEVQMMGKRKAEEQDAGEESESSANDFEDVVYAAQENSQHFGIIWDLFEHNSAKMSYSRLKEEVLKEDVFSYYVGVCKDPCWRFYCEPSPHRLRFQELWPLIVGKSMGKIERQLISELRKVCPEKMKNSAQSSGGEGIHAQSVRFLYLCFHRNRGRYIYIYIYIH